MKESTQDSANIGSAYDPIDLWPTNEVLRIEALSDDEVDTELRTIMGGQLYSWNKISLLLQEQLNDGVLDYTSEDGDVVFEWNSLCDERKHWERQQCFTVNSKEFKRDCLINLKLIPIQGGIGPQGPQLVSQNLDELNMSRKDLWVYPDKGEILTDIDEEIRSDSEDSEWDPDAESSYEDEYDDNGFEFLNSDDENDDAFE